MTVMLVATTVAMVAFTILVVMVVMVATMVMLVAATVVMVAITVLVVVVAVVDGHGGCCSGGHGRFGENDHDNDDGHGDDRFEIFYDGIN